MRTADTLVIEIINEPRRAAMIQAVATDPAIVLSAATWPDLMGRPRAALVQAPDAKAHWPTGWWRRNTSACSTFRSCAAAASRIRSGQRRRRS